MEIIDFVTKNIYFTIAILLLTLNGILYTQNVLKNKHVGWKIEIFCAIVGYFIFSVLMFKMSNVV